MESTSLKNEAIRLGFELVGVCESVPAPHIAEYRHWIDKGYHGSMDFLARHLPLKESPQQLLPGAKSIVAVGLNYCQPNPPQAEQPRIASYALGRDYHRVLRGKLKRLASWLESRYPNEQCRVCVDSAPIFERDYAQLAGLGWFGKNTCIINSQRGSFFFIGLLLTTATFDIDPPSIGGCGTCRKCIDACPTGAIVFENDRWQVDSRSCISYLTIEHRGNIDPQHAAKIGDWTFGCDVCQNVCPFNASRESQPLRAQETQEPDFLTERNWPTLTELSEISQEDWDLLSSGSAIRRTGIEGIRRNAKINLANN